WTSRRHRSREPRSSHGPWWSRGGRHPEAPSPVLALLLVAEILELGVDDIALRSALLASAVSSRLSGLGLLLRLPVHRLRELVGGAGQLLLGPLDPVEVVALEGVPRLGHGGLDALLVLGRDLVRVVPERPLGGVDEGVALVLRLDRLAVLGVLGCVRFRFLLHPLDLVLPQPRPHR